MVLGFPKWRKVDGDSIREFNNGRIKKEDQTVGHIPKDPRMCEGRSLRGGRQVGGCVSAGSTLEVTTRCDTICEG